MKKHHHTLVIVFNRFNANVPTKYLEIVTKPNGDCREIQLKRRPRTARFDEVMEIGDGRYTPWNAHRATKIYRHVLLK